MPKRCHLSQGLALVGFSLLASCRLCGDGAVEVFGECVPLGALCQEGAVFDPEEGRCIALCAEGSVPTVQGCRPAFEALVADVFEAPEPNFDPALFPRFFLDAEEENDILGGILEGGEDIDGFFFEASGRMRLLVEAFSSGLSASFVILGQEDLSDFVRLAPLPRGSSVKRELLLPHPGLYLILVGSSAALAPLVGEEGGSPSPGGEYRVVLRPLPLPEPQFFSVEDIEEELSADEVLFFSMLAAPGEILEVIAEDLSGGEAPVISLFTPDGLFLGAGQGRVFRQVGGETFFALETRKGEGGLIRLLDRAAPPEDLGVLAPGDLVSASGGSLGEPALGAFFRLETSLEGVLRLESEKTPLLFSLADGQPLPSATIAEEGEMPVLLSRVTPGVPLGVRVPGGEPFSLSASLPLQPFDEIEPNDSEPQPVAPGVFFADLALGDVDRFRITVQGPANIRVETGPGLLGSSPDTLLTILDDTGVLGFNDDIDEILCALGGSCFSRVEIPLEGQGPKELEIVVEASEGAAEDRARGDYQILFSIAP